MLLFIFVRNKTNIHEKFFNDYFESNKSFLLLVLCLFATHLVFAQTRTITGKVSSYKGEPLQGVTVTIKNTGKATTTNGDGVYTVSADGANPVLVFIMVGYAPMEVPYSGNNALDISLQGSSSAMDEVVEIITTAFMLRSAVLTRRA